MGSGRILNEMGTSLGKIPIPGVQRDGSCISIGVVKTNYDTKPLIGEPLIKVPFSASIIRISAKLFGHQNPALGRVPNLKHMFAARVVQAIKVLIFAIRNSHLKLLFR
jgi:hypothetical protein